jgi:hypothetical protein
MSNAPLPLRLYKFLELGYAKSLVKRGSIRIGTLFEYRDQERHSHGVLDTGEGMVAHSERIDYARVDQLTKYTRAAIDSPSPDRVVIRNLTVNIELSVPDVFLYCTSLSPSWDADIHPGYTTCVEIMDVAAFADGVGQVLHRAALATGLYGLGAVHYAGREHRTRTFMGTRVGGPPAAIEFLKPMAYRSQEEFRFVYEPVSRPIKPYVGVNRGLAKMCRIHSHRPK